MLRKDIYAKWREMDALFDQCDDSQKNKLLSLVSTFPPHYQTKVNDSPLRALNNHAYIDLCKMIAVCSSEAATKEEQELQKTYSVGLLFASLPVDIRAIIKSVMHASGQSLTLSGHGMRFDYGMALKIAAIIPFTSIEVLDVSYSNFGDEGAILFTAIRELKQLNITGNHINPQLAKSLSKLSHLTVLNDDNTDLEKFDKVAQDHFKMQRSAFATMGKFAPQNSAPNNVSDPQDRISKSFK